MKHVDDLLKELGILGKTNWIKKNILTNKVKSFEIDGEYYFEEDVFINIVRLRKSTMPLDLQIPMGTLTKREVVEKYNLTAGNLSYIKYIELTSTSTKNSICKFYYISSINHFNEEKEKIESFEKNDGWIRRGDIYNNQVYGTISRLKKEKDIKEKFFREFILGNKNYEYISKQFFQDVVNGVYKKDRSKERGSYKKPVLLKSDLETIIQKMIEVKVSVRGKKIYSIEDAIKILDIEEEALLLMIEDGTLNVGIRIDEDSIYINSDGIEKVFHSNGYYSLFNLVTVSKISLKVFMNYYEQVKELGIFKEYWFEGRVYFNTEIHYQILQEYSKKTLERLDDLTDVLEARLEYFSTEFKETFNVAKIFLENEIYLKGDDKREALRRINAIDDFVGALDNEMYMLNTSQIIDVIINYLKSGYWTTVCKFINYGRREHFKEARYTSMFGHSLLKQHTVEKGEITEDIYDAETWIQYYIILKNIDMHYRKAIDTDRYAETWLYCLINLSVTWRKKNIILSLPNLYLEEIGIDNFEWFKEENEFTLDMANSLIEQIKFSIEGEVAFKNNRNLHINIPLSLKVPTAIAFVICELHRRENNKEKILNNFIGREVNKKDYRKIFDEDEKLIEFSNLRCSRSIMTYGYSYASSIIGSSALAYKFNSYARSHNESISRITNTTSDYFRLINLEGGAKEYMRHIFERESFGFMYYKIFENIINEEDFGMLTQDDMTKMIKNIKSKVSPLTIENISAQLIGNSDSNNMTIYEQIWVKSIINLSENHPTKLASPKINQFIIDSYKNKANEIIGDCKGLENFIEKRYEEIDRAFNSLLDIGIKPVNIVKNIFKGTNACYTEHTNCIFDKIEREKLCLYSIKGRGCSSCVGCKYNLTTTYSLREIASKLNNILDYVENVDYLKNNEIIRNSYLVKLYLSIILEACVHFDREDNYINKLVNLNAIKVKIVDLMENNKLINFK